jgi:hypothetical protein
MFELSPRQVHLDFHTSEKIPDIAADFDPVSFANTVKAASISSMTVFARCHHGWLYYPSKSFPQLIHPNLKRPNLLLEQIRALHDVGIRAPIYITVQWDYRSANEHPEWLLRKRDGSHEGDSFTKPGFYQSLCINTGYYEFLAAHTREICELLGDELDGVFFDIVGIRPCLCSTCLSKMRQAGIDVSDDEAVRIFAKESMVHFKAKMTELIRSINKACTIFYNAGHVGPCTTSSAKSYTHFELESLPSGSWGYLHFPVTAKYARKLGKDCLGMTGKFHTEWGDFHSLKNQAALEFECFRMLSYGFACSIGDQMEPFGVLNPSTYKLIGNVFSAYAVYEEWGRPSIPLVEAAIVTPEIENEEFRIPESIMGAVQMLDELSLQYDVIDKNMDFTMYRLIILPDDLMVEEDFQERLDVYVKNGGKVISCGKGGLSYHKEYPACFGLDYMGSAEKYPDFILAEGLLADGLESGNEYVIYRRGEDLRPNGAKSILNARAPYFSREGNYFCSHRYTPSAKGETYPVAFQNGNVMVFSHPLFTQYRENAPFWCKKLIANAIDHLLPSPLVRHNGPSTVTISLLHQPEKHRINVHVLTYIPVRKSATIDIIEERTKVAGLTLTLNLPYDIKTANIVPQGESLSIKDQQITIPEVNGYCVIELGY